MSIGPITNIMKSLMYWEIYIPKYQSIGKNIP